MTIVSGYGKKSQQKSGFYTKFMDLNPHCAKSKFIY